MDDEIEIIEDESTADKEEKSIKSSKVLEVKKDIENDKLSYKSKLEELRSRVSNLKKRPKECDEEEEDDGSLSKKPKVSKIPAANTASEIIIMKQDSSKSSKPALPSFTSVAASSFEPVIKVTQPTLLETKIAESLEKNDNASSTAAQDVMVIAECTDTPKSPDQRVFLPPPNPIPIPNHRKNDNASSTAAQDVVVIAAGTDTPKSPDRKVFLPSPNPIPIPNHRTENDTLKPRPPSNSTGASQQKPLVDKKFSRDHQDDEPKPVLKIIFRDEVIARCFRTTIHEALLEILAVQNPQVDESKTLPSLELNIWDSEIPDEPDIMEGTSDFFKVDTSPVKTPFTRHIPRYQQLTRIALDDKPVEVKNDKPQGAGSLIRNTCFNCEGDHMLTACPIPINNDNVMKNRNKYMGQRKTNPKTSRYHVDEEQRFAHLKPGCLSDSLREALGVGPRQLPRFVYRMRMFGYPPGWLEEARITHSGIAMINESAEIKNTESESNDIGKDTFDISKIIEYPGFNVEPEHDVIDESHVHRCPGMHWQHSKEAMINNIGDSAAQAYKKKKLKKDSSANGVVLTNDDMEVVEINDEVMIVLDSTADNDLLEESSQPTEEDEDEDILPPGVSSQDSSRVPSPDLVLLEAQKQSLLMELEKAGNTSNSETSAPSTPLQSSKIAASSFTTPVGQSKSLSMGTPIIDSASPFSSLPNAKNFSQGISDHLNFENLPDATGKYEQMKGIIKKVKEVVDQTS